MKRILLFFCSVMVLNNLYGQLALTDFNSAGRGGVATTFATDYQSIGINPANLGYQKSFRDPKITIGFLETSTSFSTDALSRNDLLKTMFNSSEVNFSYQDKINAANNFAGKRLSTNVDIMLFGISIKLPKGHGLAFNIRDRIQFFATFNQAFSEFMFLGGGASIFPKLFIADASSSTGISEVDNPLHPSNAGSAPLTEDQFLRLERGTGSTTTYGELFDGSKISSSWYREYNISYGKQLFESYDFELFAGIGFKYIQGFWLQDLEANNGRFNINTLASSESFGLNFKEAVKFNPISASDLLFPKPSGKGYGVDLGVTAIIRDNLHIGLSINNIGSIDWTGNVVEVNDGVVEQFTGYGLNNYNVLSSQEGFGFGGTEKQAFEYGEVASTTIELPSTVRFGASYQFFRTVHVGFDMVFPRNDVAGNITSPLFAFGGDFRPMRSIRLSTGFNFGGNNGAKINIPGGITYQARKGFYEIGVATSDLATWLVDLGTGSTFSVSGGFLRFKLF